MRGDIIHVSDTRRLQRRRVNVRYILKNLGRYIRPYALLFVLIFFASLAGTACSLLGPQVCGMAIDEIKLDGTTDFAKIWTYAAVLVAVYIASGLLTYLSSIGMSYLSRCVVKRIRTDIFARLTSLPVSYFDTRQAGDIISVLVRFGYAGRIARQRYYDGADKRGHNRRLARYDADKRACAAGAARASPRA